MNSASIVFLVQFVILITLAVGMSIFVAHRDIVKKQRPFWKGVISYLTVHFTVIFFLIISTREGKFFDWINYAAFLEVCGKWWQRGYVLPLILFFFIRAILTKKEWMAIIGVIAASILFCMLGILLSPVARNVMSSRASSGRI